MAGLAVRIYDAIAVIPTGAGMKTKRDYNFKADNLI